MKTLHDLFQKKSTIQTPENLLGQILARVNQEQKKKEHREQIAWGGIFLASLATFIASGAHAVTVIASSNFGSYVSLIFTDTSSILSIWKQASLSLIESLPFIELIVFLGSIAVVMWSIRNFSKKSSLFINRSNVQAV